MIKPTVLSAIGKQIQHEQSNARAYEAASLYFGRMNLPGLEAFMARQALEERMHADKLIAHVSDRGGAVELLTLPAPRTDFASPLDAAGFVRDLERTTTEAIHRLFDLARREADYALEVLLHWYITEQVEEEDWSGELAAVMQTFQEHPEQLFMFDQAWGKRVEETQTATASNH